MSAVEELNRAVGEVVDLERAAALATWDQEVMMPTGGVDDRADLVATVSRIAHERFTGADVERLIERAASETDESDYDSFDASVVRVTRRQRERDVKVPAALVEEMARAYATAIPRWVEARSKNDWQLFQPEMERTIELSRRLVDALGWEDEPFDALIDLDETGWKTAEVEALFATLRQATLPLVETLVSHSDDVDDSVLDRELDPDRQLEFSRSVVAALGYSFDHGRLDISAHPFTVPIGAGDVRITTRVKPQTRDSCVFSSIHEAGHGMYYQGVPRALDRTRLWGAASPGVNESQSRLWENQVGRSLPFWQHFFPRLQALFPSELSDQDAESYFRANNKVRASYIRVDADEVTYNLHIMLRFELEKDLLSGALSAAEFPDAWDAKLKQYLGLPPPPVGDGCLQDIHYCFPELGSFVGYTLGNMIAAQLMESVREQMPNLDELVAAGEFKPLLEWLQANVHAHGRKYLPKELVERATGRALSAEPLIAYLRQKYSFVYRLEGGTAEA